MDELSPSPEIVARHRSELQAAIAAEGSRPSRRIPRRTLAAVAAAAAVLVGAGVVASRGDDAPDRVAVTDDDGDPTTTPAPAPVPEESSECGTEIPFDITLPPGFVGPVDGPSPDVPVLPAVGQTIEHWTNGPSTIELRWPLPPTDFGPLRGLPLDDGRMLNSGFYSDAEGHSWLVIYGSNDCETLGIYSSDPDPAVADDLVITVEGSIRGTTSSQPLVTGTGELTGQETIQPCEGGNPNEAASIEPAVFHAEPQQALTAFLAAPGSQTMPRTGYVELRPAGGEQDLAYAALADTGNPVVLIHVHHYDQGWAVEGWEASGC